MQGSMISARLCLSLAVGTLLFVSACGDGASSGSPAGPEGSGEIHEITIEVGEFVFDARVAGPEGGEPVILLHGFPSTSWQWKNQLAALGLAGYRAVAPNQRGYSPGARPEGVENYNLTFLIGDVLGMADALGFERFHLVGHDWGAGVAWGTAVVAPQRLLTLNPISVPHPDAMAAELADPTSCQYQASSYFDFFVQPGSEENFIANDNALLKSIFEGVPPEDVAVHVETLGNREAMRAGLNWYRANITDRSSLTPSAVGSISVPTMFIWSDADTALCREGAEATGDYVDAPYQFHVIERVNHWVTENAPEEVSALLLGHLG